MSSDSVLLARPGDAAVALVTLNRPHSRNILTADLVEGICTVFDELENDPSIQCAVLTGAGTAFCAGAELRALAAAANGDFEAVEAVYPGFLRVLHSPVVTIAAVNGPAVGAGLNLALACDIRIAGPDAVFDTRFAQLRIHPGGGHLWMLTRAVGYQQALLASLVGETWDAPTALRKGLVAEVAADDPVGSALRLGHRLDTQEPDYSRRFLRSARGALQTADHADALAAETELQRWSTTRPAFRDGVHAIQARTGTARRSRT